MNTITVDYRERDGCHFFTSKDVFGLFVVGSDPIKAYNEVPVALAKLARLNEGAERVYTADQTAESFFRHSQKPQRVRLTPKHQGRHAHAGT